MALSKVEAVTRTAVKSTLEQLDASEFDDDIAYASGKSTVTVLRVTMQSHLQHLLIFRTYTVVSRIYAPLAYKPPLRFQPKFLHRYFYLAYRPPYHGHSTKMIFVETTTLSSSRSPWQRKNGARVHRTAKEFAVDR